MASAPRLIVLGGGTAVPRAGHASSCYAVDDGAGTLVLVDAGPGALHRAAQAGLPLESISAILLTHVHPDHCADLVALLFALRSPLVRADAAPLFVIGHHSFPLLMNRLRNAWPGWLAAPNQKHQFIAAGAGARFELGPIEVTAFAVNHIESSLGWRLRLPSGFELAFSGDTLEGGQLEELGRDVDLFVLEGAVPDAAPFGKHLTPRRAARVAAAAGAKALLLTHLYPETRDSGEVDAVGEAFDGPWTVAADGQAIELLRPARLPRRAPGSPAPDSP